MAMGDVDGDGEVEGAVEDEDEEREARSDGELGANGSWYLPDASIQTIYEVRNRRRRYE